MDVTIPCPCPQRDGQPSHDSDTVTLRDRLDFHRAAAIRGDIVILKMTTPDASAGETLGVLTVGYIRQGIEAWSLVNSEGKPLPVTRAAIDGLAERMDIFGILADAADELYAEAVMLPLLGLASPSSPDTPMESSTSAEPSPSETTDSSSTSPTSLRRPSKPSSTSTSPTDGTARTTASRGGDSSSSQSSTSAA